MSDSILRRVAEGDNLAVQECIQRFGGLVWSLARRMSATSTDAEDATQDIFVDLWKCASSFDPGRASETTFVTMIARRRLIDQFRKRAREIPSTTLEDAHDPPTPPAATIENQDEYQKILQHMRRLRDDERQVIELSVLEGISQGDIAKRLKMPLGTVKTNARRGMRKLREFALAREGGAPETDHV